MAAYAKRPPPGYARNHLHPSSLPSTLLFSFRATVAPVDSCLSLPAPPTAGARTSAKDSRRQGQLYSRHLPRQSSGTAPSLARSVLNMPSPVEPCQPATPALFSISPSRPFSRSRSISSSPSNSTVPPKFETACYQAAPVFQCSFCARAYVVPCSKMKISNAR